MSRRPRVGDFVHVVFMDHVRNGDEDISPLRTEAVGQLVRRGIRQFGDGARRHRFLEIRPWFFGPDVPADVAERNVDTYTILTSTVESIVQLVPAED